MKTINRDLIKYLAIILMAIDHVIQALPVVEGYTYDLLDGLSHFTYVTMAFFMIESYKYTHSKKEYLKKMLIFAAIAQIPFTLAALGGIAIFPLNILFTLAFNFILIWLFDKTDNIFLNIIYGIIAVKIGCFCDWMFMAPIIIMLFWWARDNKVKQWIAYILDTLMVVFITCGMDSALDGQSVSFPAIFAAAWGVVLSAICTLCLYNGKKMEGMQKFNKWFFYVFYPAHLLIIGLVRIDIISLLQNNV